VRACGSKKKSYTLGNWSVWSRSRGTKSKTQPN